MTIDVEPWVAGAVFSLAIIAWCVERCVAHWRDSKPLFGEIVADDEDAEGPGLH